MMWRCESEESLMIFIAVWIQYMNVKDGQTDTNRRLVYRALRIASRGKNPYAIHSWRYSIYIDARSRISYRYYNAWETHSADRGGATDIKMVRQNRGAEANAEGTRIGAP